MKMIHMREEVRASICAHANVWHGSNTISTIPFFVVRNVIVKLFLLRYSVMFSNDIQARVTSHSRIIWLH